MDEEAFSRKFRTIHTAWERYGTLLSSCFKLTMVQVSRSEHAQIESRLDDWAEQLLVRLRDSKCLSINFFSVLGVFNSKSTKATSSDMDHT